MNGQGAGNYDKVFVAESVNRAAIARAVEAAQVLGGAIPCSVVSVSGSMVTVSFDVASAPWALPQVTIPKAEPSWVRSPTQVGDLGVFVPARVDLGGIDGLGAGTSGLALTGNLSNGYWLPVASTKFPAIADTNKAYASGPDGVFLETEDHSASIDVSLSGITIKFGGKTWTFNGNGFTDSNSVIEETHLHPGVQPGPDDTGPPVN